MKLRKSEENVLVSGVLGGFGKYYQVDPTLLRIGFAILTFVSAGTMIPLYIIAALVMPEAQSSKEKSKKKSKADQKIDKSSVNPHNMDSFSETNEIEEEDWSDF